MSTFTFVCPFCNRKLDCDGEQEGLVTACPSCGGEIVPTKESNPMAGKMSDAIRKANESKKSGRPVNKMNFAAGEIKAFHKPILSVIFCYAGVIETVIAVFMTAARLCSDSAGNSGVYVVALILFVDAFLNFGLAQVISYVARTCWNSERIAAMLQANIGGGE